MDYLDWNNRIAKHFFNGEMADREVLLYVTEDLISTLGGSGGDIDDFLDAVREGPPWVDAEDLCVRAYRTYLDWRERKLKYPPYLGFLALFVLAEDVEGEFDIRAYYPRLAKLLGESGLESRPPTIEKVRRLWTDLEIWSTDDKKGQLGRFKYRIRGQWIDVGAVLSQTFLLPDERQLLPFLFDDAELDPTDLPSPEVLQAKILRFGQNRLARRTLKLLEDPTGQDRELRNACLDFISEELSTWDGHRPEEDREEKTGETGKTASIRICLETNHLAAAVNAYLRFKSKAPISGNELHFQNQESGQEWVCQPSTLQWSSVFRIKDGPLKEPFDASLLDWRSTVTMKESTEGFVGKLSGSDVRLFRNGKMEGLPGWIEAQRLDRSTNFIVAAHVSKQQLIEDWGKSSCIKFRRLDYKGLPPGWCLYSGMNAKLSCEGIDQLTLSSLTKLRLEGGIKNGPGIEYLVYALPRVRLENPLGGEILKVDGKTAVRKDSGVPVWNLPDNIPVDIPVEIEAVRDNQLVDRTRIRIIEPGLVRDFSHLPKRNGAGEIAEGEGLELYSTGARVGPGFEPDSFPAGLPLNLSDRIVFIGLQPGQICDWPREGLPEDWWPIWALGRKGRKKWEVHFCGKNEDVQRTPVPVPFVKNRKLLRRWKKAIWFQRHRNSDPEIARSRNLWGEFKRVAKNV